MHDFSHETCLLWPLSDWTWERGFWSSVRPPFLSHPLSGSSSLSPSVSWQFTSASCFSVSSSLSFTFLDVLFRRHPWCSSSLASFLVVSSLGIICGCGKNSSVDFWLLSLFSPYSPPPRQFYLFAVSPCSQFGVFCSVKTFLLHPAAPSQSSPKISHFQRQVIKVIFPAIRPYSVSLRTSNGNGCSILSAKSARLCVSELSLISVDTCQFTLSSR
jgi:hypothetical protein